MMLHKPWKNLVEDVEGHQRRQPQQQHQLEPLARDSGVNRLDAA
jgi:hypothetical protein